MRKVWLLILAVNLISFVALCGAIESPQYTVVHLESDIRHYRESVWISAPARDVSFEKATINGFHRCFWKELITLQRYIMGANLNFSRIAMTGPVLTSIVPGAGPFHSSGYFVSFHLPVKFQATPPLPLPELNLKPYASRSHCVTVRKFSGFARDDNIVKEAEKLAISLSRSPWANSTSFKTQHAYSIAQYNSPFRFIGCTNEVWVDINAPEVDDCKLVTAVAY